MKTIEIEESVYLALEKRVQGFSEKPNDVIKRLLAPGGGQPASGIKISEQSLAEEKLPLISLIESPEYRRGNGKDRYFDVLRFIYKEKGEQFEKLDGFSKGFRVLISKNRGAIQQSGTHTYPQQLDQTPYWVMTNLSNERKETILDDIMRFLGYREEIIEAVIKSISA